MFSASGNERRPSTPSTYLISPDEAAKEMNVLFIKTEDLILGSAELYDTNSLKHFLQECDKLSGYEGRLNMYWEQRNCSTRVSLYPSIKGKGLDLEYTISAPVVGGDKKIDVIHRLEEIRIVKSLWHIDKDKSLSPTLELEFRGIKGPLLKLSQNGDIDDSNFEGRFSIK